MGLAAGLFISLLILLQLTFSDSRVRTSRQLLRLIGFDSFLGRITSKVHDVRDRRVALILHDKLTATSRKRIRLIPIRSSWENTEIVNRLSSLTGAPCDIAKPFTQSSVVEIAEKPNSDTVDVLLVLRNQDLRKDVVEGLIGLQRSNRHLAGVLLVD
jgi:capsular polysaccharide biosynthesis protein